MFYIRRFTRRLRAQLRKPFKGNDAYEWQVGPLVFFWMHDAHYPRYGTRIVYKLRVWRDRYWWSYRKYSER